MIFENQRKQKHAYIFWLDDDTEEEVFVMELASGMECVLETSIGQAFRVRSTREGGRAEMMIIIEMETRRVVLGAEYNCILSATIKRDSGRSPCGDGFA